MGFDNESILNPEIIPGDYYCPLCRQLVHPSEAQQALCGHLFCRPCLLYVVSTTRCCPYDNHPIHEADQKGLREVNVLLYNSLCRIAVRCVYHKSGCPWQGQLAESTAHSTSCPHGSSLVLCNRCGVQIMHRQVNEHAQVCSATAVQQQQMFVQSANGTLSNVDSSRLGQAAVPQYAVGQGQLGAGVQQSQQILAAQVPQYGTVQEQPQPQAVSLQQQPQPLQLSSEQLYFQQYQQYYQQQNDQQQQQQQRQSDNYQQFQQQQPLPLPPMVPPQNFVTGPRQYESQEQTSHLHPNMQQQIYPDIQLQARQSVPHFPQPQLHQPVAQPQPQPQLHQPVAQPQPHPQLQHSLPQQPQAPQQQQLLPSLQQQHLALQSLQQDHTSWQRQQYMQQMTWPQDGGQHIAPASVEPQGLRDPSNAYEQHANLYEQHTNLPQLTQQSLRGIQSNGSPLQVKALPSQAPWKLHAEAMQPTVQATGSQSYFTQQNPHGQAPPARQPAIHPSSSQLATLHSNQPVPLSVQGSQNSRTGSLPSGEKVNDTLPAPLSQCDQRASQAIKATLFPEGQDVKEPPVAVSIQHAQPSLISEKTSPGQQLRVQDQSSPQAQQILKSVPAGPTQEDKQALKSSESADDDTTDPIPSKALPQEGDEEKQGESAPQLEPDKQSSPTNLPVSIADGTPQHETSDASTQDEQKKQSSENSGSQHASPDDEEKPQCESPAAKQAVDSEIPQLQEIHPLHVSHKAVPPRQDSLYQSDLFRSSLPPTSIQNQLDQPRHNDPRPFQSEARADVPPTMQSHALSYQHKNSLLSNQVGLRQQHVFSDGIEGAKQAVDSEIPQMQEAHPSNLSHVAVPVRHNSFLQSDPIHSTLSPAYLQNQPKQSYYNPPKPLQSIARADVSPTMQPHALTYQHKHPMLSTQVGLKQQNAYSDGVVGGLQVQRHSEMLGNFGNESSLPAMTHTQPSIPPHLMNNFSQRNYMEATGSATVSVSSRTEGARPSLFEPNSQGTERMRLYDNEKRYENDNYLSVRSGEALYKDVQHKVYERSEDSWSRMNAAECNPQKLAAEILARYPLSSQDNPRDRVPSHFPARDAGSRWGIPEERAVGPGIQPEIDVFQGGRSVGVASSFGSSRDTEMRYRFSQDVGEQHKLAPDASSQQRLSPELRVRSGSMAGNTRVGPPKDVGHHPGFHLDAERQPRFSFEKMESWRGLPSDTGSYSRFGLDIESQSGLRMGAESRPAFHTDGEGRSVLQMKEMANPGLPMDMMDRARLSDPHQDVIGRRSESLSFRTDLKGPSPEPYEGKTESKFRLCSPRRVNISLSPRRGPGYSSCYEDHFSMLPHIDGPSPGHLRHSSPDRDRDLQRVEDTRMKPVGSRPNALDLDPGWLPSGGALNHSFNAPRPGIGNPSGRLWREHPVPGLTSHLPSHGSQPELFNQGSHFKPNMTKDGPEALEFGRKRKQAGGSSGWCRICNLDYYSVEGLESHCQTEEHQKRTLEVVMSIKHDTAKMQKQMADDTKSMGVNSTKSRRSGFETHNTWA